jgi:clan AA aspartic protease (TIGR02281 family)
MRFDFALCTSFVLTLVTLGAATAADDSSCDEGIRLYNKKDYKAAIVRLEKCLRYANPSAESIYYAALTYHQLGNIAKAKETYQLVIDKYPETEAAALAQTGLLVLDPVPAKAGTTDSLAVARPADLDSLPRETWIDFVRMDNHVIVDAELNKHPIKMVFDTGADTCLFSLAQLSRLGVHVGNRPPDTQGMGVGNTGSTPIWFVRVDLKVGKIERRNFPVAATNSHELLPLLGQNFFKDFQYTIDDSAKAILFKRSGKDGEKVALGSGGSVTVSTQGHYVYSVPYKNVGREIVVVANVNGKDCPMIFDTGATTCFFTTKQFASLGLMVSPNAPTMSIQGVSGSAQGRVCIIDHLKLGPIDGANVMTAVSDRALLSMPLLGQNFFKEWKYTIDSTHKVINFEKR